MLYCLPLLQPMKGSSMMIYALLLAISSLHPAAHHWDILPDTNRVKQLCTQSEPTHIGCNSIANFFRVCSHAGTWMAEQTAQFHKTDGNPRLRLCDAAATITTQEQHDRLLLAQAIRHIQAHEHLLYEGIATIAAHDPTIAKSDFVAVAAAARLILINSATPSTRERQYFIQLMMSKPTDC